MIPLLAAGNPDFDSIGIPTQDPIGEINTMLQNICNTGHANDIAGHDALDDEFTALFADMVCGVGSTSDSSYSGACG
jgi:hypothetical protein